MIANSVPDERLLLSKYINHAKILHSTLVIFNFEYNPKEKLKYPTEIQKLIDVLSIGSVSSKPIIQFMGWVLVILCCLRRGKNNFVSKTI